MSTFFNPIFNEVSVDLSNAQLTLSQNSDIYESADGSIKLSPNITVNTNCLVPNVYTKDEIDTMQTAESDQLEQIQELIDASEDQSVAALSLTLQEQYRTATAEDAITSSDHALILTKVDITTENHIDSLQDIAINQKSDNGHHHVCTDITDLAATYYSIAEATQAAIDFNSLLVEYYYTRSYFDMYMMNKNSYPETYLQSGTAITNYFVAKTDITGYTTAALITGALNLRVLASVYATDKLTFLTSSELTTALAPYALTTALNNYVLTSALTTALTSYVQSSSLTTTLASYVLTSSLGSYITETVLDETVANYQLITTMSEYYTKGQTDAAISSATSNLLIGYASEPYVENAISNGLSMYRSYPLEDIIDADQNARIIQILEKDLVYLKSISGVPRYEFDTLNGVINFYNSNNVIDFRLNTNTPNQYIISSLLGYELVNKSISLSSGSVQQMRHQYVFEENIGTCCEVFVECNTGTTGGQYNINSFTYGSSDLVFSVLSSGEPLSEQYADRLVLSTDLNMGNNRIILNTGSISAVASNTITYSGENHLFKNNAASYPEVEINNSDTVPEIQIYYDLNNSIQIEALNNIGYINVKENVSRLSLFAIAVNDVEKLSVLTSTNLWVVSSDINKKQEIVYNDNQYQLSNYEQFKSITFCKFKYRGDEYLEYGSSYGVIAEQLLPFSYFTNTITEGDDSYYEFSPETFLLKCINVIQGELKVYDTLTEDVEYIKTLMSEQQETSVVPVDQTTINQHQSYIEDLVLENSIKTEQLQQLTNRINLLETARDQQLNQLNSQRVLINQLSDQLTAIESLVNGLVQNI